MPSPEPGTYQALRLDMGASPTTIKHELEDHLNEFYFECLKANGIKHGDELPDQALFTEAFTAAIANEVYLWLKFLKGI